LLHADVGAGNDDDEGVPAMADPNATPVPRSINGMLERLTLVVSSNSEKGDAGTFLFRFT
jgi:hypothetical protein